MFDCLTSTHHNLPDDVVDGNDGNKIIPQKYKYI